MLIINLLCSGGIKSVPAYDIVTKVFLTILKVLSPGLASGGGPAFCHKRTGLQ